MRQTNIVWVGMALGCTVIDKLISQTIPFVKGYEKREKFVLYSFKVNFMVLMFETVTNAALINFLGYFTSDWFLLQTF